MAHGPPTIAYVAVSEISCSLTLAQQSMAYLDFNYYAGAFIGSVWRSRPGGRALGIGAVSIHVI